MCRAMHALEAASSRNSSSQASEAGIKKFAKTCRALKPSV